MNDIYFSMKVLYLETEEHINMVLPISVIREITDGVTEEDYDIVRCSKVTMESLKGEIVDNIILSLENEKKKIFIKVEDHEECCLLREHLFA